METRTTSSLDERNQQESSNKTIKNPKYDSQDELSERIGRRSRKVTICLLCFLASISCLTPYLNLHLTQRVGFLLFESDILQLRASLFSTICCILVLVIFFSLIAIVNYYQRKNSYRDDYDIKLIQRTLRQLISLCAIISALAYLSLALIVPHIRQIQRMPLATFDCNANLITIENCYQQFTTGGGGQTISEAFSQILVGDLNGNNQQLIKKLNCLKYNDNRLEALQVPTRFLLHKCGLVCKPQRQQLHQFSDDLNRGQQQQQQSLTSIQRPQPPYDSDAHILHSPLYTNTNLSAQASSRVNEMGASNSNLDEDDSGSTSQVSVRVCFSEEFTTGSNYKQFCITNLVSGGGGSSGQQSRDHTLTVGQLNAMLRRLMPGESTTSPLNNQDYEVLADNLTIQKDNQHQKRNSNDDQTTHYVNPVVQFESHFKNWPHLSRYSPTTSSDPNSANDGSNDYDGDLAWCKFRPIPPFIVNNKPFSDIQCSLEHEYTMTTGPSQDSVSLGGRGHTTDNIYLKKSALLSLGGSSSSSSSTSERCNIQCKVNILYQIHLAAGKKQHQMKGQSGTDRGSDATKIEPSPEDLHYYLPLKPCVIISGHGDKPKTSSYYLLYRSIGDSTLIIVFISLDLFLLLESIDTKQSQLEGKRFRLIGLLVVITLTPLVVAILFDVITFWSPTYANKSRRDGYLVSIIQERVLPAITGFFSRTNTLTAKLDHNSTVNQANESLSNRQALPIDNFLLPFFLYSVFMFILAINALQIPQVSSSAPLVRVSSVEELGLQVNNSNSSRKLDHQTNKRRRFKTNRRQGENHDNTSQATSVLQRQQFVKLISFALISLFMGIQFNLIQSTQSQILIDTFGNPTQPMGAQQQQSNYPVFLFTLVTQSSATLIILLIALLLIDEISTFFGINFASPFRCSSSAQGTKQNHANFLRCLTVSLAVYSARFFVLANLSIQTHFKWLIVLMFQMAELFNFPLTWLALCTRAHQLVMELTGGKERVSTGKSIAANNRPASESRTFGVHLLVQSGLALIYFGFARTIALFTHCLYASLHLHSDNVDWFITTFYGPRTIDRNGANLLKQTPSNNNATTITTHRDTKSESLFSPLPSERQTYVHASRIFLRYNSLVCLMLSAILLINFIYLKYQLWAEQRRTLEVFHARSKLARTNSSEGSHKSIDDQLSLDLMRIHQANISATSQLPTTRTIYPVIERQTAGESSPNVRHVAASDGPRARILFHYDLGRKRDSIDVDSISSLSRIGSTEDDERTANKHPIRSKPADDSQHNQEIRIPIQLEDGIKQHRSAVSYSSSSSSPEVIERVVSSRNKRVRIFEDGEDWPTVEEPSSVDNAGRRDHSRNSADQSTEDVDGETYARSRNKIRLLGRKSNHINSPASDSQQVDTVRRHKQRSITFAPKPTFIGSDGKTTAGHPQYASPESSIDSEEDR